MPSLSPIHFKVALKNHCISLLQQRIQQNQLAIDHAQESANQEEKSSAGDKYETSRAMSHREKDMYARQMEENKKALASLISIDCNCICEKISPGCLVNCGDHLFFIATGLGKISFRGKDVFILSQNAPLVKLLLHKKKADRFPFAGRQLQIQSIY